MKKIITVILLILMAVTASGTSYSDPAPEEYMTGDFSYIIREDGTAEITKYSGDESDLIIPPELDRIVVTSVGENAFRKCSCLKSVKLPDSILNIGERAFLDCEHLKIITIPDSVIAIGANAFAGCKALHTLILPEHLKGVPYALCWNCESLMQIYIPAGGIGTDAFGLCDKLHDVYFCGTEEEWDHMIALYGGAVSNVLNGNFGLITSVGQIHYNAVPTDVVEIFESSGYLYRLNASNEAIIETCLNTSENELVIPQVIDGYPVKEIGALAFRRCYSVPRIIIPNGVTKIGKGAFINCDLMSVELPESLREIGDHAFYGCMLGELKLPKNLQLIGDGAFSHISVTDVIIPDSVTSFGNDAFVCSALEKIYISHNHPTLELIDGVLFSKPDNRLICHTDDFTADHYTIPQGTEVVEDYAFSECNNMTSITIPDSVIAIGENAFNRCDNLVVVVGKYSYAHQYCIKNGLQWRYES